MWQIAGLQVRYAPFGERKPATKAVNYTTLVMPVLSDAPVGKRGSRRDKELRMATPHGSRPAAEIPGFRDPGPARIDVYQLYRDQMHCLAGLPGQVSEFQQNRFGYEWRCEFDLDTTHELQLQFSLVDLQSSRRPAAVLYLVEDQERKSLFLEDLNATHEQLNGELARLGASIDTLEKAHEFISALAGVRDTLGEFVSWD